MEQMEPAAAASGSRPSSSGSVSATATSRPTSGGVKSKLKRKRTVDSNGTSKPSAATANSQRAEDTSTSSSSSSSLTRKKGGTRRKKQVISRVFAARRQARGQQQQATAAAATTSGTGLTFPDDVTYKFGGGAGHNDGSTTKKQTGSSSGRRSNGTAPNRSGNSDDDTDPCSSGTEENEFDWSQSQRQSQIQKQQTGNANIEDSQDSMESAGSLQSAASGSANGSSKQMTKRRKRNAIGTSNNNGKPPIPSFSPVEWSHGDNDDDSKADQTKPNKMADKSTIMSKSKSKQKATKSIKRVGVGFGSPSSSSSSDENEGSAVAKGENANSTKKDKESRGNPHAADRSSPGISSNDRAASAAAKGDEALALVEAALAKSASASGTESAPAGKVSISNVLSESIPKENAPAPALDLSTAANLAPVYDNVEISASIFAADSSNNSNGAATASAQASESKGTASKDWNCSACTLLNPSRKRKCDACGKTKPVESRAVGDGQGAKSPVIDLSLDDAGEKDNVTDNGKQQKKKERQTKATASKQETVKEKKEKTKMTAKKQSGQDGRAKESSTDTKKGKSSKAGKKEDTATTATGTTKPKAAQKKRKQQQQPKKRAAAVVSSPIDDDAFDIPVSKQISDKEKMLDRQHADLLRQLAKKPSPGKDSDGDDKSAPKRTKRGGAACALCSTCSCSRGSALKGLEETAQLEAKNPISKLARSDAEIERALLGRLARLEKSASWFDTLCYKVGRELKKHRNKVTKKRASLDENNGGGNGEESKPRFLADADVDGQDKGIFYPRAKKSRVAKAHQGLFGTEPTVKEVQPTLTQMMKGEDGDDESDDDDDTGEKQAPDVLVEVNAPKGTELEPIAEEDNGALQNLGSEENEVYVVEDGAANDSIIYEESEEGSPVEVRSPMADYHDASQRGLERTSENSLMGMWDAAKSSAPSKRDADVLDRPGKQDSPGKESASHSSHTTADEGIDDDFNRKVDAAIYDDSETGIDDLLGLFQGGPTSVPSSTPSPEKAKPPPEIQSQLTQRGQDAFEELSEGIMADPARRQAIEAICPNWRDNIQYPLLHKKSDDLDEALANVRDSRRKLQVARERILTELKQREEAMDLFEEAISSSMNRFAASTNNDVPGSPDSGSEEKKSN